MNEPNTTPTSGRKERNKRRSFKQKILDSLIARKVLLQKRLQKVQTIQLELKEIEKAIESFEDAAVVPLQVSKPEGAITPKPIAKEDLYDRPNDDTPLSEKGLTILKKIPKNFSVENVECYLDNNKGKAYQYIAAWKRKYLITTTSYGKYTRLED